MITFKDIDISSSSNLALVLSWRNNPIIYKHFLIQSEIIKWEQHYEYWMSRSNRRDFFIIYENRPIGHIAIDNKVYINEISIMIGEVGLWGNGIASHVLEEFISKCSEEGIRVFTARISKENFSSVKLFLRNGFEPLNEIIGHPGWYLYEKIVK